MAAVLSFRSSRLATLGRQATGAPPAVWRPRQRQGRPSVAGGAGAAAAAGRRPLRVCAVAQPLGPAVTPHEVDALHAEVQLSVQERLRGYYQVGGLSTSPTTTAAVFLLPAPPSFLRSLATWALQAQPRPGAVAAGVGAVHAPRCCQPSQALHDVCPSQLLRGWNALPSMALVLLGAWTGAGKTLLALKFFTGRRRHAWKGLPAPLWRTDVPPAPLPAHAPAPHSPPAALTVGS